MYISESLSGAHDFADVCGQFAHAFFLQAQHRPNVGGGLLPIAECQSLHVQADPPPSGASPLPHFLCTSVSDCQAPMTSRMSAASSRTLFLQAQHSPHVGGGLVPIAECQPLHVQADPPPSGASPLPHFLCISVSHCQAPMTSRMSAASSRTRSSSVSHAHMNRAPPLPMKV